MLFFFVTKFLILILCLNSVELTKFYEKIYESVYGDKLAYCPKLLNQTNIIGCDGSLFPKAGILLTNVTFKQLDYINKSSTNYKFVPVLYATELNLKSVLLKLNQMHTKISGVLVLKIKSDIAPNDPNPRSDDVSCPNELISSGSSYRWINSSDNLIGSFFVHWFFPIFYIDDEHVIEKIHNCTDKHNKNLFEFNDTSIIFRGDSSMSFKTFCAAELYNPTYASSSNMDAKKCLQLKDRYITLNPTYYCNHIFPQNLVVPLIPMHLMNVYGKRSILLLVTRTDSFTLFSGKSPAADSLFTALIASISIAKTLAFHKEQFQNTSKQILFAFYGGESLDNIGSSYHAYELNEKLQNKLENKSFVNDNAKRTWIYSGYNKITLENIGYILELNQLATYSADSTFWLHSKNLDNTSLFGQMVSQSQFVPDVKLSLANQDLPYPPSSVYSFIPYNNQTDVDIEIGVITNHEGSFTNRYYHSVFDNIQNILPKTNDINVTSSKEIKHLAIHISKIVTIVSRTLAQFIIDDFDVESLDVEVEFIEQLIDCIFVNHNCSLFHQIRSNQPEFYNESNFQSTAVIPENLLIPEMINDLMRFVIGDNVTCPNITYHDEDIEAFDYYIIGDQPDGEKQCVRYQYFSSIVYSPYFLNRTNNSLDIPMSEWVVSHKRSRSFAPRLRIFVLPPNTYQLFMFVLGIVVLLLSVVVVYFTSAFLVED